jgi:F0F1-type ATP synthase assembly protein I
MSMLGPEEKKQLKLATRVSAVGLEMVLATLVGWFGGSWLDGRLHTAPYLTYAGLAIGLVAAFNALWTIAKKIDLDSL